MTGLTAALSVFDPDPIETRLFRAALNESAQAFAGLANWDRDKDPDLVAYLAGSGKWMRGHLPLLYANLSDELAQTALHCRPYLKTAALRERKRYDVYLACAREAMAIVNEVGRGYCVVKGAAVANTVYPAPYLRHCHDLDLIVRAQDQSAFVDALQSKGFRPVQTDGAPGFSARLDHPTGLPVLLHTQPVPDDTRIDAEWMLNGALRIQTEAGVMTVPRPARRVVHAWLHRFGSDRHQRQAWVPDTVQDLRAMCATDHQELAQVFDSSQHFPEALASMRYLVDHFDRLPHLDALTRHVAGRHDLPGAAHRARLVTCAKGQSVMPAFAARLDARTRALMLFDRVLPPRQVFGLPGTASTGLLWRYRLRRLARGVKRRLSNRRLA